jgi:AcrR family transcriptional regulator
MNTSVSKVAVARWRDRSRQEVIVAEVTAGSGRRAALLAIAARLFAERGFKNTTVRDIAEEAGILSGSLYHHFASKEAMVDELLDTFQTELWEQYDAIDASDRTPREKLEAVVRASFDAIDQHHSEVAIFQTDAAYLSGFERFSYLEERNKRFRELWTRLLTEGVESGELRADLDIELVYRFLRDTVWVAVRWYRPGGGLSPERVADQYLSILLEGNTT